MDPLSKGLFEVLACPKCKGNLEYADDKTGLHCADCDNIYKIKDGIPVLM